MTAITDPKPPLRCWDCPNCEEVHGESQTYWSRFQAGEFACEVCGGPLVLRKLGGSFGEADPAQAALLTVQRSQDRGSLDLGTDQAAAEAAGDEHQPSVITPRRSRGRGGGRDAHR